MLENNIEELDTSDFETWRDHPITKMFYNLLQISYNDVRTAIAENRSFEPKDNYFHWYQKGVMDAYYNLLGIDLDVLRNNEENFYDIIMEDINEWNE